MTAITLRVLRLFGVGDGVDRSTMHGRTVEGRKKVARLVATSADKHGPSGLGEKRRALENSWDASAGENIQLRIA
jgi:hypothetical protein